MKHKWNRPNLPDNHQGTGIALGVLLLIAGGALVAWGFMAYGAGWAVIAGSGLASLSILIFSVSLVLREIRQMAFEAALRAGEAVKVEPTRAKAE